ncbi:MAG TPA: hypothetical protein VIU65_08160 [Pyrinomonadaceae bacterium]
MRSSASTDKLLPFQSRKEDACPAFSAGQRGKLDVSSALKPARAITRAKLSSFLPGSTQGNPIKKPQKWATSFYILTELLELLRKIEE